MAEGLQGADLHRRGQPAAADRSGEGALPAGTVGAGTLKAVEAALITKSTQLLTDALTQQTTLRRQATTDTLKLIDDRPRPRSKRRAATGQTEGQSARQRQRVENEILATKRQTMTQALAEYRQHIDALNAEANRHLAEIKRIEEEKRQLSMTTEERIRDIRRQGMTDFEATEDRKRQIAEYQGRRARRWPMASSSRPATGAEGDGSGRAGGQLQTSEAKRGEDARKQSEQAVSQVTQLESQSRDAYRKQEYAQAEALMRQGRSLRAELARRPRTPTRRSRRGRTASIRPSSASGSRRRFSTRPWMPKPRRTRRRRSRH